MTTRRRLLLLFVLCALVPAPAAAAPRHVRLRIDGYLGAPPEGKREDADLTLRVGATDYRFQVTHAIVLSGGGFAADVFERRRPYKPTFLLRGPKELLERFTNAKSAARLRIIGMWLAGQPDFLVASVEPLAEP
jgi:hypothetical protein